MKALKIFLAVIVLLTLVVCKADAQTAKVKTLNLTQWVWEDATDYSLSTSGDSVLTYTFLANKADDLFYDIQVKLDSVSGTPDYDVDLKGKVFENDSWSDLETDVTWDGTSSDTTILFQEHSTAEFYRYFQLQVNGQASTGAATVTHVEIKFWP
jgi:hypothetical protein